MSKKYKRQARRTTPLDSAAPVASGIPESFKPTEKGFNPDYSYVTKDLKRIGTLAGTFFVILVVLSFFLR
jgi:hypothetical protein